MPFSPLAIKLKLKPWYKALILNQPTDYFENVKMNDVIYYNSTDQMYDFVHIFVYSQDDLNKYVPIILSCINDKTIFWISYPKITSKNSSNIRIDKGWDILINNWFAAVALVSYDDNLAAMRFKKLVNSSL